MPHFDEDGNETVICQACGKVVLGAQVEWMRVPGMRREGNVCKTCREKLHDETAKPRTYEHYRSDGKLVRVTIPEDDEDPDINF